MKKTFRSKLKFLISLVLVLILLPTVPVLTASAKDSFDVKTVIKTEKAVQAVVSDNVKTSDIDGVGVYTGQMGIFNNGTENVGMENGLVISTGKAGNIAGVKKLGSDEIHSHSDSDKELETLADYKIYDKAYLEFTMENTQSFDAILTFNYAFGSTEFDQPAEFNDCFGLFVDYNLDGKYDENIAKLPNGKIVTIQNIKKGHYYTGSAGTVYKDSFNGMSNVFTAQTTETIKPGGKIRLKIAIADISDNIYNSAVFIQGNSVSIGKKIEPPFISGENFPNGILNSEFEDKETTCTYQWYIADAEGKEGKILTGENSDKLNVTEDMVGKYAYLVVTGTGEYSGTATSNYVLIEDLPLIKESFSYYTNFHYTEPYTLSTFAKGETLTVYYYRTKDDIVPSPKEMLSKGTAVPCTKTVSLNGVNYCGADLDEYISTKDVGDNIYVMFAKKTDKAIIHSGIKNRQLLGLFKNARSLGFTEKQSVACDKLVDLYNALKNTSGEDIGDNLDSVDFSKSSIKDYKGVSLTGDFSKEISINCSKDFGLKISGTLPESTENFGVMLYNCNKDNLSDVGYSRDNIPSGEELLKIKGLEVYSLKDNNLKIQNNTITAFNMKGVKPTELDVDYILAFWYMDNEGVIHMEKPSYVNLYDILKKQSLTAETSEKEVLSAVENVYLAVKALSA